MGFFYSISALLAYLLLYKYAALFVFVFISAIGFPVPGNIILLAVGAFVTQGYFDFGLSLIVAFFANIFGDLFDYFLMRKYGRAIISKNYHKRFSFIARLEPGIKSLDRFIKSHEGITIFFTRFLGSANTIVNFWSGLIPVPFKKFIFFDAFGNLLAVGLMLSLGFFADESWLEVAKIIGVVGATISASILVVIIWLFVGAFKKRTAR